MDIYINHIVKKHKIRNKNYTRLHTALCDKRWEECLTQSPTSFGLPLY